MSIASEVIGALTEIKLQARDATENVNSLTLNGAPTAELFAHLRKLLTILEGAQLQAAAAVLIDDVNQDIDSLQDIDPASAIEWQLNFSKKTFALGYFEQAGFYLLFFLDSPIYGRWIENVDPLSSQDNHFTAHPFLVIASESIKEGFGGNRFAAVPTSDLNEIDRLVATAKSNAKVLPDEKAIREQIHIVPDKPMTVSPASFDLSWGATSSDAAKPYRRNAAVTFAATLADVVYSVNEIVLKGVRHLNLKLISPECDVPVSDLMCISDAVVWAYEERTETRKKLLVDRLTLDMRDGGSFIEGACKLIPEALQQARDQYKFVILDRVDEYARELRELLVTLRQQSDLYSEKVRQIVGSLLRDALAAFVFVALSLAAEIGQQGEDVLSAELTDIFFKALAIYFIVAGVAQISSTLRDVQLSNVELKRWTQVIRNYTSQEQVDELMTDHIKARRDTLDWFLIAAGVMYSGLAAISWCMQTFISGLA